MNNGNAGENKVKIVRQSTVNNAVKSGVTFGSCLAMIISYTAWKSIGWAILHGIFSWGYVLYYLIRYVWSA